MEQDVLPDHPQGGNTGDGNRPTRKQGETLGQQVTDAIIAMIGRGQIVPGQRLVESTIASTLGVGTVPVREALRVLAGDGVVKIIPNRGAILCSWSKKEIIDTLKAMVGLLKVALDAIPPEDMAALAPRLEPIITRMTGAASAGDKLAFFGGSEQVQKEILLVANNLYILRSVARVHFDFYNVLVIRHVEVRDLKKLARKYLRIQQKIAEGDGTAVKRLFEESATMLEGCIRSASRDASRIP